MTAKVVSIRAAVHADRLSAMHKRISESIVRVQARTKSLNERLPAGTQEANIDNAVDEGFKDLRAIEAGYLAITGRRIST